MAKKKSTNASTKAAGRAAKVAQTIKNKATKLARHVKAHPADGQAATSVGKPRAERKKPFTKGSAPKPNRSKLYLHTVTGQPLGAPNFTPTLKTK